MVGHVIAVKPESPLGPLLDEADDHAIMLTDGNKRYRLERDDTSSFSLPEPPDAAQVLEVLDATAGSWSDIDPDTLIDEIYRLRSNDADQP